MTTTDQVEVGGLHHHGLVRVSICDGAKQQCARLMMTQHRGTWFCVCVTQDEARAVGEMLIRFADQHMLDDNKDDDTCSR